MPQEQTDKKIWGEDKPERDDRAMPKEPPSKEAEPRDDTDERTWKPITKKPAH